LINSVISDVMYCQSNSLEDCVKVEIEIMVSIYLDNGIKQLWSSSNSIICSFQWGAYTLCYGRFQGRGWYANNQM